METVVRQREIPSYITAACSFEFILLSVQNTNCISKQLTYLPGTDLRWLSMAVNSYMSQCYALIYGTNTKFKYGLLHSFILRYGKTQWFLFLGLKIQ